MDNRQHHQYRARSSYNVMTTENSGAVNSMARGISCAYGAGRKIMALEGDMGALIWRGKTKREKATL